MQEDVCMRIELVVRNGSILSVCMPMAVFATSVFVLLVDHTDLLLTPSLHFLAHVLIDHAYLTN